MRPVKPPMQSVCHSRRRLSGPPGNGETRPSDATTAQPAVSARQKSSHSPEWAIAPGRTYWVTCRHSSTSCPNPAARQAKRPIVPVATRTGKPADRSRRRHRSSRLLDLSRGSRYSLTTYGLPRKAFAGHHRQTKGAIRCSQTDQRQPVAWILCPPGLEPLPWLTTRTRRPAGRLRPA